MIGITNIYFATGLSAEKFTFSGSSLFAEDGKDWDAALLSSGVLTVRTSVLVDLALVAGGMPGLAGVSGKGGVGGAGGGIALFPGVRLRHGVTYTVTIGGSGQNTVITGSDGTTYTAVSGAGAEGGQPSSTRGVAPTAGGPGSLIWGGETLIQELANIKFGPGGGAGGYRSSDWADYVGSSGGADGGGNGGGVPSTTAKDGAANRGSGGGGAWRNDADSSAGTPGLGGSGIVMFRPHKEVAA